MNIKQIDFLHIFKIAAAASIGCLLAVLFQLQTPTSAGIIAILSLQNDSGIPVKTAVNNSSFGCTHRGTIPVSYDPEILFSFPLFPKS